MNRTNSVVTKPQVLQTNKRSKDWYDSVSEEPQNIMVLKYFGKSDSTDSCSA